MARSSVAHLVTGHVPDQSVEKQHRVAGVEAPARRGLPRCLAGQAQAHSGDGRTLGSAGFRGKWSWMMPTSAANVGARPEVVGAGRRSMYIPCFTWINTVLGYLNTALVGTYHAFNFRKYAHRYLAECQYRFNRRFDLKTILPRLLRAAIATGPCTET